MAASGGLLDGADATAADAIPQQHTGTEFTDNRQAKRKLKLKLDNPRVLPPIWLWLAILILLMAARIGR